MKLKRIDTNEKTERIPVNLKASVAANLQQYLEFYKKTYNVSEISKSALVEAILRDFMAEDKEFAKFLANAAAKTK